MVLLEACARARTLPRRHSRTLARTLPAAGALLVLWSAGAPAFAAEDSPDQPPVLLRQSLFFTPVETAGTGLAPEVKVRLTVDERGRVQDVEVLSIDPSSDYDDLFRETTTETLDGWHYAPARKDGEPVATSLAWSIQFQPRTALSVHPADLDDLQENARLERILTRPPEAQATRLRNFASLAEQHLRPGARRRVDTPRFVLITDSPDQQTASTLAGDLEAVFGELDELFAEKIPPRAAHFKQVDYVYTDRSSFQALAGELTVPEWANGLYAAPGLSAFHLETGSADAVLDALIHETVHAYIDQHLCRPGEPPPPWLAEGLAEYLAKSEIQKGRLVPGQIREGKYVLDLLRGGAYRKTTAAGWRLDDAQRALRKGEAASVATLIGAAPEEFYGEHASMHYSLSWLLVHYLRHGEPGWATEEFPDLLLYVAEGYPAAAALEAVYGRTAEELGPAFAAYVKDL